MVAKSLNIFDLTSERKEKKSEGWLLWELMRILELDNRTSFEYVRGRRHFFEMLNSNRAQYLHIGAHGSRVGRNTGLQTALNATISTKEITEKWIKKQSIPSLLVMSACQSGHIDMVRTFSEMGVKYVVAPLNDTYWEDAAVFLTLFYKLLLSDGKSPWISYRNAICGYKEAFRKISGAWRFYNKGEHIQVECRK